MQNNDLLAPIKPNRDKAIMLVKLKNNQLLIVCYKKNYL